MATGQTGTDQRVHPVIWVLVGVLGTLAVGAAVTYRSQLSGRQPSDADGGGTAKADVSLPLPPAPPDPVQPVGFPVVVQPGPQGQQNVPSAPKPADTPKDIPDRVFNTPQEVVRAYTAAKRWEDRLPCVLDPKAIRQLMAARYKNVDLSAAEAGFLPGTLTVKPGTGNRVIVDVDVRESLPYHQYLRYAVVKSGAGYKVDWLESIKLGEEDSLRAEVNKLGLTTPVLEIQVVKKEQSGSYTSYDLRVVNRSNKMLLYWKIDASVYDKSGAYLGKGMTNGTNLKAGAEVIVSITFFDVKQYDIDSWKPQIGGVDIEVSSGVRAEAVKHFTLKEVKGRTR